MYLYLYILLSLYITSYTLIDYSNNIINFCRFLLLLLLLLILLLLLLLRDCYFVIFLIIIITFYIFLSLLSSPIQYLFGIFYLYFNIFLIIFGNTSSETVNNIQ